MIRTYSICLFHPYVVPTRRAYPCFRLLDALRTVGKLSERWRHAICQSRLQFPYMISEVLSRGVRHSIKRFESDWVSPNQFGKNLFVEANESRKQNLTFSLLADGNDR